MSFKIVSEQLKKTFVFAITTNIELVHDNAKNNSISVYRKEEEDPELLLEEKYELSGNEKKEEDKNIVYASKIAEFINTNA